MAFAFGRTPILQEIAMCKKVLHSTTFIDCGDTITVQLLRNDLYDYDVLLFHKDGITGKTTKAISRNFSVYHWALDCYNLIARV